MVTLDTIDLNYNFLEIRHKIIQKFLYKIYILLLNMDPIGKDKAAEKKKLKKIIPMSRILLEYFKKEAETNLF